MFVISTHTHFFLPFSHHCRAPRLVLPLTLSVSFFSVGGAKPCVIVKSVVPVSFNASRAVVVVVVVEVPPLLCAGAIFRWWVEGKKKKRVWLVGSGPLVKAAVLAV